ncbi:MAG: D-2-hydroxyacid dehydrogenase [Lentisphaeria bacterium]|nr:D-2-hydroxyacid dehydrogenase [Lentisphaeria bacterium]
MDKIVVLDGYTANPGDLDWDELKKLGNVEVFDRTPPECVVARAAGARIVLTNKTVIGKTEMAQLPELRMIGVLATGYNIVDVEAAGAFGITVCNVPAYSSNSVAQLVFGFILEWMSQVHTHSASVHAGKWAACPDFSYTLSPLHELAGKTLGIVGFGRIGQTCAQIALGFGMNVLAVPHSPGKVQMDGVRQVSMNEMLEQADFVTLHCPLTAETKNLVDADFLRRMKNASYLINTARGPLVDESALADALQTGHLAGAAADVLSAEPPTSDNPLLSAPNMLITPHLAWAAVEARKRLLAVTVENVSKFQAGTPVNVVS